jgi:hypothetical protein
MMNVKPQAAPIQYPISRTEAKLFCRIPSSNTVEDSLVDMLIAAAVDGVEQATGLALASRKYVGYIDGFPGFPYAAGYAPLFGATPFFGMGAGYFPNGPIGDLGKFPFAVSIPIQPVTAVEKIVYLDVTGAETTLLPGRDFVVDLGNDRVRVGPLPSGSWPLQTVGLSSVRIYFTAGYTTPVASSVSNVAITGNVLTVTATNTNLLSPGQQEQFSGLATATFLNGQTVTIATVTPTQFTAALTHADYASAADTGTATTTDSYDVIIGGTPTPPQQSTEYKFATGIPPRLKQLMLLLINEGYVNRSINVAGAVGTIPTANEILSAFTTHDFSVDRT